MRSSLAVSSLSPDIVDQQGLHAVDVIATTALELVLDHVEEAPMQALDQVQGLEILRLHIAGINRLDGFPS